MGVIKCFISKVTRHQKIIKAERSAYIEAVSACEQRSTEFLGGAQSLPAEVTISRSNTSTSGKPEDDGIDLFEGIE